MHGMHAFGVSLVTHPMVPGDHHYLCIPYMLSSFNFYRHYIYHIGPSPGRGPEYPVYHPMGGWGDPMDSLLSYSPIPLYTRYTVYMVYTVYYHMVLYPYTTLYTPIWGYGHIHPPYTLLYPLYRVYRGYMG